MMVLHVADSSFGLDFLDAVESSIIPHFLQKLADQSREEWKRLAQVNLRSSRLDYLQSIQPVEMENGSVATISLVGGLANFIEQGDSKTRDMRDWLLGPDVPVSEPGSQGKHQSANGGYYRRIPFGFQTPGTAGLGGQIMGSHYPEIASAKELGKAVHRIVKSPDFKGSKAAAPGSGKRVSWGDRIKPNQQYRSRKLQVQLPKFKDHHKSNLYAGMVRLEQPTKSGRTQSTYKTFRTISSSSGHADSWMRGPRSGAHLVRDLQKYVQGDLIPKMTEQFLAGVIGGGQ